MSSATIYWRIRDLIAHYGGLRQAARRLRMDAGYLKRLMDGEKTNPSDATLKKLRIKRTVSYSPMKERP